MVEDIDLNNPHDFYKAWFEELGKGITQKEAYENVEARHMAIFRKNGQPKRKYSDFASFYHSKRQYHERNGRD